MGMSARLLCSFPFDPQAKVLWDSSSSASIHKKKKKIDEDYHLFHPLTRQLATSIAAAVLFEDEMRRARITAEQATMDRYLLSRRLAIQTHEALENESRFRRVADTAPVGMFHINPARCLVYANEHWYNLTQQPRDISDAMVSFHDDISPKLPACWHPCPPRAGIAPLLKQIIL